MWAFTRRKPEPASPTPAPGLLDLQERMEKLERVVRDLRTDWEATYDKFHRMNMRIAKRAKMLDDREFPEDSRPENTPGRTNGEPPITNPLAIQLLQRGRML